MKKDTFIENNKDILLHIIKKISELKNPDEKEVLRIVSKNTSSDFKTFSKSQIIEAYQKYKKELGLTLGIEKKFLEKIKMKKVRTISGVTPVAVLTKPYPCPGRCIYCPNDPQMPKSYLTMEPGAQRALSNEFDPYLQVFNRLVAYKKIGHPTEKIELIVLGGTWSFYPLNYRIWFVKRCFDALNDFNPAKDPSYINVSDIKPSKKCTWEELSLAHKKNEGAYSRCVGLVLETRPDFITEKEVINLRKLGATKIQIGIQSLDDKVLKMNKRGHGVKETKEAIGILRSAGFKIHVHWMPNLYGSSPSKDIKDFKKLFTDEGVRPDELKIYPCSLILGTELHDLYKKGKWKPYNDEELLKVLEECISFTPRYCRLSRVVRDISSDDILVGNKKSNFRQIVEKSLESKGIKINDIRYREIRNEKVEFIDLNLNIVEFDTAVSKEFFLEYITKEDKISGFLRLSLPKKEAFIKELKQAALIREVHVYGTSLGIGKKDDERPQHSGLGSKLICEAEKISLDYGFKRISVISSIGTREYYQKLGYQLDNLYQSKDIK